ncbi:MAG: ABC transporter permease, partial [Clostridia bacterium]
MVFINSIRSIVRSKGKTALFTLLIFVLTLALALGVCVWASVEQFLADCDEYYTTVGIIEYVGTGYPDDTACDTYMAEQLASFDTSSVINDEATLLWDISERSMGYIDGFWRTDTYAKDRMMSVFLIGNVFYNEDENVYNATVMKSLYSLKVKDDTIVYLDEDFGTFEYGRYYLVYGEVYYGRSPLMHLRVKEYSNAASATEGIAIPHVIDVTDGKYYSIPEDCILTKVADTLKVTCNSVLVNSTDDLMALFPFHQNELYFTFGRAFTEEEYANGSNVCVITEIMAARLGVGIGD